MQPQLCKLFQSKLKYNKLQKVFVLLLYRSFVFELANSCGSIFEKVLLGIYGIVWRF